MAQTFICIDCGRTVDAVRRSRCSSCYQLAAKRTKHWTGRNSEARQAHQAFITSSAWRRVARDVKRRDGACRMCGTTERLTVHHLIPSRQAPDLALDPNNCVTLCRSCHGRAEVSRGGGSSGR